MGPVRKLYGASKINYLTKIIVDLPIEHPLREGVLEKKKDQFLNIFLEIQHVFCRAAYCAAILPARPGPCVLAGTKYMLFACSIEKNCALRFDNGPGPRTQDLGHSFS